ncbi:uncharacterized protein LOC119094426 [Pollicipes pollicipes]|uniref:uncharacterized protein LOC119094426 n=1 Tax=Pollicipes pollicipes TaxID=41117 RepID=UPI0018852EB2|nr:uncharacterized protein LOC119094426 [Pollicipes pollicipes]
MDMPVHEDQAGQQVESVTSTLPTEQLMKASSSMTDPPSPLPVVVTADLGKETESTTLPTERLENQHGSQSEPCGPLPTPAPGAADCKPEPGAAEPEPEPGQEPELEPEPAPTPAPEELPTMLPTGQLGQLAEPDQSCFVCGQRWQRSLRFRLQRDVFMFALPTRPTPRRDWLLSLHWSRSSAPPADAQLCSLHFAPSDCRPVLGRPGTAQLLPVALPRRRYFDGPESDCWRPCSYPLCRGQRSYLCCLHFAPKWFRWENRGRPRQTPEPLGQPKLDKYAEPTIFSTSALIAGLKLALEKDLTLQADLPDEETEPADGEHHPSTKQGPEEPRCDYPYCSPGDSGVLFTLPSAERGAGHDADCSVALLSSLLCSNHFSEESITRTEVDGETVITLDDKAVPHVD